MASIDVRCSEQSEIDNIIFAGSEVDEGSAVSLQKGRGDTFTSHIAIVPADDNDYSVVSIESKEHAQNLIKALEKAIELKWFK